MAQLLRVGLAQRIRVAGREEPFEIGEGLRLAPTELEGVTSRLSSLPYAAGRAAARAALADIASDRGVSISPTQVESSLERIWPSLTPISFLRDLLGSRERLVAAAGDQFTAGDVNRLLRPPAERISEESWTDADVALLDEADELINGRPETFAHLVIDEAQDLSPMQLRSLQRRSTNGSMTVVGDLAQSTGPWARDTWDDIATALGRDLPIQREDLTLGYRVPQQVFELAKRLLPEAAPDVTPPRVVRVGPAEPDTRAVDPDDVIGEAVAIAQEQAGMGLFVGVVCPDSLRDEAIQTLTRRGVSFCDSRVGGLGKSINLLSPAEAKGLEFDSVVVIEPERIVAESDRGLRMLYVALTRTTRFLSVVHSGPLLPLTPNQQSDAPTLPPAVSEVAAGEPLNAPDAAEAVRPASDEAGTEDRSKTDTDEAAPVGADDLSGSRAQMAPTDISNLVVAAAAAGLADSLRGGVPAALWPRVLDRLRRDLGVTSEQALDHLD
jgi:hypothetical protein